MNNITHRRLEAMSLEELYTEQRGLYDLIENSEKKGLAYAEAWETLLEIPLFISKRIAGDEYIKIRQAKREVEPEECGYDLVLHEQLMA
jgi:hypothetical protein